VALDDQFVPRLQAAEHLHVAALDDPQLHVAPLGPAIADDVHRPPALERDDAA